MIKKKILNTIKSNTLINSGDKIVIGLSGGADSVCLTHTLFSLKDKLGISIAAAHINHCIRGEEADRDEEFAKRFARSLGIDFYSQRVDIPKIAKEKHISEETAGRQARYDFFYKLCSDCGIDKIATAHNRNDNAETIMMNFMRGSGIQGLCGIPYRRGNIIRPLLDITREEIKHYCGYNGLSFVTDSTNNSEDYTRNKVRRILLPMIEQNFNQGFITTLTENAVFLREDNEFLEQCTDKAYKTIVSGNSADITRLKNTDIALRRRILRKMISNVKGTLSDIPLVHIDSILTLIDKSSGKSVNLSDGVTARLEYGRLVIEQRQEESKPFYVEIKQNSSVYVDALHSQISVTDVSERKKDGAIYLSCEEDSRIVLRSRREGDIFYPYGMTGKKKVKEYLINEKIPRPLRNFVVIVEINGEIASVGQRADRRFLFNDKGIKIEIKPVQEV